MEKTSKLTRIMTPDHLRSNGRKLCVDCLLVTQRGSGGTADEQNHANSPTKVTDKWRVAFRWIQFNFCQIEFVHSWFFFKCLAHPPRWQVTGPQLRLKVGEALLGVMWGHQITFYVCLNRCNQRQRRVREMSVMHSVHTHTVLRRALSRHNKKHLCVGPLKQP